MPRLRILSERLIRVPTADGDIIHQVNIAYRPVDVAQVGLVTVPASSLPDVQWLLDNPDGGAPPSAVLESGEAARRRILLADLKRQPTAPTHELEV